MSAELRSPLAERQKRGVEHAAGLVGLLALVPDLGLEVVPTPKSVAVLPAGRECRDSTFVHEARDALEVGLVICGVRHIFEVFPVGHLDLHEACPPFRVGDHRTAVAVLVDFLELLPALRVRELDARRADQLGFDSFLLGLGLRFILRLTLLATALVLFFDVSVACLLLVREDGVRVGADALADVAVERPRPVAIDELGVGIRAHADGHAVELELHHGVEPASHADRLGDCARDVRPCHDVDAVGAVVDPLGRTVEVLQVFHESFLLCFGL